MGRGGGGKRGGKGKYLDARYVTKRMPGVGQEFEYLFVAYSVFTVEKIEVSAGKPDAPHVVYLKSAHDNLDEPHDLPLSPWY